MLLVRDTVQLHVCSSSSLIVCVPCMQQFSCMFYRVKLQYSAALKRMMLFAIIYMA